MTVEKSCFELAKQLFTTNQIVTTTVQWKLKKYNGKGAYLHGYILLKMGTLCWCVPYTDTYFLKCVLYVGAYLTRTQTS